LVALAAVLLAATACSPQCGRTAQNRNPTPVAAVPTPSPSPIPTAPLVASSPPFHAGEAGVVYAAVALSANGGVAPYRWTVVSGGLPDGLTLGTDGKVAGSPTTGGTFSFTIQVADAGGGTASIPGTIAIADPLTATLIPSCIRYCKVELGCSNACGDFGQLAGGVGPYSYSLSQGQLPAGTTLSGLYLGGTFRGLSGYLQFTVQVSDAVGGTTTISPTFWMYDHISVGSGSCYRIFTDCSLRLPISGGVPGGNPSVALVSEAPAPNQGCWYGPTPLPAGYTLTVSGGYVNLYIPRSQNTGGYGAVWTVVVTDHTDCAPNTYCTAPASATIGIECT
jgi:large repetitive protein